MEEFFANAQMFSIQFLLSVLEITFGCAVFVLAAYTM